jgi:hypothetical protein
MKRIIGFCTSMDGTENVQKKTIFLLQQHKFKGDDEVVYYHIHQVVQVHLDQLLMN